MTLDLPVINVDKVDENTVNTLRYRPGRCIGCGRCTEVCPHRVFEMVERKAHLVGAERCMECGACQANCPAHAMINAALRGKKEVTCGDDCCGN